VSKKFITHLIAEYISKSKYEDFPPEVIHKAKKCILDSIGCMFGGIISKEGKILIQSLLLNEIGHSTIIGYSEETTFLNSIYINPISANILDFDDSVIGHPGATVVPPAINLAELFELSGKELIVSVIIAYEISIRLGINLQPLVSRESILGHGTWQTFGSASVVCKLLNLSNESIANAFGIAGANAPVPSVMKTTYGLEGPTMAKNNFGSASMAGIQAGLLAKHGFTGPKDILDGDTGFWRMIGLEKNQVNADIFNDLGKDFKILDIYFKLYPCCRFIHPTIDKVKQCIKKNHIELEKINKIFVKTVSSLSKMPFIKKKPESAGDGRFSLPYTLACALFEVNVLKWYDLSNLNNYPMLDFANKVEVQPDKLADETFQKDQQTILSRVCLVLDNDKKYFYNDINDISHSNTSLSLDNNFKNKIFQLTQQVLKNSNRIDFLITSIMELEDVSNIKKWLSNIRSDHNNI